MENKKTFFKLSKFRISIFTIMLLKSTISAQSSIAISGRIFDSDSIAIEGATVTLVKANVNDITDANGDFILSGSGTSIALIPFRPIVNGFMLHGKSLHISIEAAQNVSIAIYNIKGQCLQKVLNKRLERGAYSFPNPLNSYSYGTYVFKVSVGTKTTYHSFLNIAPDNAHGSAMSKQPKSAIAVLSKRAADVTIDTIIVRKNSIVTKRLPISTYIIPDTTIIVERVNEPVLKIDDIYTAIDTVPSVTRETIRWGMKDTIPFNVDLTNIGARNALSVVCTVSTDNPLVEITRSVGEYNNIIVDSTVTNFQRYYMVVPKMNPPIMQCTIYARIADSWGGSWTDSSVYIINPFSVPMQVVDDDMTPDSYGNGNGLADSGEVVEYTPQIENRLPNAIQNVKGRLYCIGGLKQQADVVRASDRLWAFGNIQSQQKALPELDYVVDLRTPPSVPNTDSIPFILLVFGEDNGKKRCWINPITIPTEVETPSIVSHPISQTVTVGETATFDITANGIGVEFQWQKDNTDIFGALSNSFTTPAVILDDNQSSYRCIAKNLAGADTSDAAILTVLDSRPIITEHPISQTVAQGASATFHVEATGENLNYQWQKFNEDISGETAYSYMTTSSSTAGMYRCIVSNSGGSDTSNYASLKITGPNVIDIDGNQYTTVVLGNQIWTVENFRSTKYNDGTGIPLSENNWAGGDTTPAYCFYGNTDDTLLQTKWGALYNWYAVNTGKLAPVGWRIPTDGDWIELENFLINSGFNWDKTTNGNKVGKSLAAETDWRTFWDPSKGGAVGNMLNGQDLAGNNGTGFSALPSGLRNADGNYTGQRNFCYWWSATEREPYFAGYRHLNYDYEELRSRIEYYKWCGFSIRIVKSIQ